MNIENCKTCKNAFYYYDPMKNAGEEEQWECCSPYANCVHVVGPNLIERPNQQPSSGSTPSVTRCDRYVLNFDNIKTIDDIIKVLKVRNIVIVNNGSEISDIIAESPDMFIKQ